MKLSKEKSRIIVGEDQVTRVLKLDNWEEYVNFIIEHKDELVECLYRGQSNPKWKLVPGFFRDIPDEEFSEKYIEELIRIHFNNIPKYFRNRHESLNNPLNSENEVLMWALGQHYGLKTIFLDWVRSPYVACYFSFSEIYSEKNNPHSRAIYILDGRDNQHEIHVKTHNNKNINLADLKTTSNERSIAQQGELTYIISPFSPSYKSIEDYINTEINDLNRDEFLLLKITLPDSEREKILEHLDLMNINHATLFPDLNGAAEHCNYLLQKKIKHMKKNQ